MANTIQSAHRGEAASTINRCRMLLDFIEDGVNKGKHDRLSPKGAIAVRHTLAE